MQPQFNNENVTVRNGYWFYFNDDGLKITAFGSGISGKEIIFVGEEIVSSKRALKIHSKHTFTHLQAEYEIEFLITNYLTGELECILRKNGEIISRATKAYYKKGSRSMQTLKLLAIAIVGLGAVIGFLIGKEIWK
jgi:hypothetical protein